MYGLIRQARLLAIGIVVGVCCTTSARAQDASASPTGFDRAAPQEPQEPPAPPTPHDHASMQTSDNAGWQLMQDGILFTEFNHQGGPRGGNEFVVPNWWMGM